MIAIWCCITPNTTSNSDRRSKIIKTFSEHDKRSQHKNEAILRTLQITETDFGSFEFEYVGINMTPPRVLIWNVKTGSVWLDA